MVEDQEGKRALAGRPLDYDFKTNSPAILLQPSVQKLDGLVQAIAVAGRNRSAMSMWESIPLTSALPL